MLGPLDPDNFIDEKTEVGVRKKEGSCSGSCCFRLSVQECGGERPGLDGRSGVSSDTESGSGPQGQESQSEPSTLQLGLRSFIDLHGALALGRWLFLSPPSIL